jgi:hypothetical protein
VEIASPVVVNEKGDSRVSRKWERLALRGSMVVLFGVCAVRRRQVRCGVRIQLALFYPQDYGFDGRAVRAVKPYVSALQPCFQQRPAVYSAAVRAEQKLDEASGVRY